MLGMDPDRRLLAAGVLVVLMTLSGCSTILGPGEADPDALAANATYDWNTSANGTIRIEKDTYSSVYRVEEEELDEGRFELYERDALGTDEPLEIRALQYRFSNGSRVYYRTPEASAAGGDGEPTVQQVLVRPDGSEHETTALGVERTRKRTLVDIPSRDGKLAFTVRKGGGGTQISTPTFVEGSYHVVLPPETSVSVPLIARVRPSPDRTETVGDRMRIHWNSVEQSRTLLVRFYLDRDIKILGGIVALFGLAGIVGAAYYLRQIRELRQRREEVGLDIDIEDDSGRDPPPGMG